MTSPQRPAGGGDVTPAAAHGARSGGHLPPGALLGGGVLRRVLPTDEQWQKAEINLLSPFGFVNMTCDQYTISVLVNQVEKLRMGLFVYVDGFIRGRWLIEDCEERRRFMRPSVSRLYSRAEAARFKALERSLNRLKGGPPFTTDYDKTLTLYYCHWNSFATLKRHLLAHNHNITITSVNE